MLKVESQSPSPPLPPINVANVAQEEKPLVWPWIGVLANIPIQWRNGCFFGPNGLIVKQHLTQRGFNPLKVEILWGNRGHSGFALVDFNKDLNGYNNAMVFETTFQENHRGNADWNNLMLYPCPVNGDDFQLYGWIAREDDYMFEGIVGHHLRNLKEVFNVRERMSLLYDLDTHVVSNRMDHNCSKRCKVGGFSMRSKQDMKKGPQYNSVRKQEIKMRKKLVESEVQNETELSKIQNEKYVLKVALEQRKYDRNLESPVEKHQNVESLSQIDCGTSSLPHPAYKSSQTRGNQFSFTKLLTGVESLSQVE